MTLRSLAISLTILWSACAATAAPVIDLSALKERQCRDLSACDWVLGDKLFARCATLILRQGPSGSKTIEIAVAVLEPTDPAKAKNTPTVIIHGGPGVGIVDAWWWFASMAFAQDAPVILFDQRGAGLSAPKLCPELDVDDAAYDKTSPGERVRLGLQTTKDCVAKLKKGGTDFTAYGTDVTVRDMEALRNALKLETWSLYGVSYGTTVGLAYLAKHPDRVRAAVLDSVYPPEMKGFSSILPDFMQALAALDATCAARPRCAARFGNIEASLRQAINALNRAPLPLDVVSYEGVRARRHLSSTNLLAIVQSKLLFSNQWPQLPLLIADAAQGRSTKRLARAFQDLLAEQKLASTGVYLATECRERAPFEDREALKRHAARWPEIATAMGTEGLLALCDGWPATAELEPTPQNTAVPTLVVAGQWDPVTPPEYAQRTAAKLGRQAHYVLLQRQAHGATFDEPCAAAITQRFLEQPTARPDTACATAVAAPLLATRVIDVDESAAYNLAYLPASSYIFLIGLVSAFIWPFAWLGTRAREHPLSARPVVKRSAFWLTLGTISAIAATYPLAELSYAGTSMQWQSNGLVAEAWPTFLLLSLAVIATPLAALALPAEVRAGASIAQLFHRGLVLVSLIAVLFSAWRLGVLSQLPVHLMDEAALTISSATGTTPPPAP